MVSNTIPVKRKFPPHRQGLSHLVDKIDSQGLNDQLDLTIAVWQSNLRRPDTGLALKYDTLPLLIIAVRTLESESGFFASEVQTLVDSAFHRCFWITVPYYRSNQGTKQG